MATDPNKNFAGFAAIFLIGGVLAMIQTNRILPFLGVCFAIYMMLVATNGIRRGELHGRKNKRS